LKKLFQNKRKTGQLFNEIINEEEDENLIQPEKIKNSLIIEILKGFSGIKNYSADSFFLLRFKKHFKIYFYSLFLI